MKESESIINSLLFELESLTNRLRNIKYSLINSNNNKLKNRLIYENRSISGRVKDIYKISNLLVNRSNEKINYSELLYEQSKRTLNELKNESNLFFL